MASLSMVGTWIGCALAISMQEKPPAAEAAASAAEDFKKSRRPKLLMSVPCRADHALPESRGRASRVNGGERVVAKS